jgi:hypothetical protein
MSRRIREHLQSNVVGYVALFFALTMGTAWALGANSVKSKHIKDGQVWTEDVANDSSPHALTGDDIATSALTTSDIDEDTLFNDGSLTGADISQGSLFNDNSLDNADVDESTLYNDNSLNNADVDESTLYNDNSLNNADVDESTLYNDSSLTGADIDESTLSGVNADKTDGADLCSLKLTLLMGETRTFCSDGTLVLTGSCVANPDPRVTIDLDTTANDAFWTAFAGTPASDVDFDDVDGAATLAFVDDTTINGVGAVTPPVTLDAAAAGATGSPHMAGTVAARVNKTGSAAGSCELSGLMSG